MIILYILGIFFLTFVLIKSADQVVIALRRLSIETHTKTFILATLLIAVSTSFPELFVGITSALEGSPQLSLGNVLGANITNITLVAGLSAFIVGRVSVHGEFIRHEVGIALLAGILPILLIFDGELSRVDGLILLASYGAYASSFFKRRFLQIAEAHKKESFVNRFLREISHPHINVNETYELGRLFVAIALLLFSASLLVRVARDLATTANIPLFLIGLILLSIGTTLPELAFSFRSLRDKEPTMFFGNILGSIIANSTLVIGIAATISPITNIIFKDYITASAAFIIVVLTFWFFIRSKLRLDRWEAGVLLILYIAFVVVEFWK